MATGFITILVFAAVVPTAALPEATVQVGPSPRGSIEVLGDGDFTPLAGVREGDGSATSPYVISGYRILPDRTAAIRLAGTRAHVLIEEVEVAEFPTQPGTLIGCVQSPGDLSCLLARGLELDDAQNVTVRNLRIPAPPLGARIIDSRNVVLDGLQIADPRSTPAPVVGVRIEHSSQVTVRHATVAASFPIQIFGGEEVVIASSTLHGMAESSGRVVALRAPTRGVAIEDSRFEDAGLRVDDHVTGLALRRNSFRGPNAAVGNGLGTVSGLIFCGNEVRDTEGVAGLALFGEDLLVLNNTFENNTIGVLTGPSARLEFTGNRVVGNREEGVWSQAVPALVRGNTVAGNAGGSYFPVNGTDARGNWWGAPSGPGGIGPGQGETLRSRPGVLLPFDPWLTAEPAPIAGCGAVQEQRLFPRAPLLAARAGFEAGPARLEGVVVVAPASAAGWPGHLRR